MLPRRKRNDIRVAGREMANRIGGCGISREHKGLAPAAAMIDFPPRATAAGFLHPGSATK